MAAPGLTLLSVESDLDRPWDVEGFGLFVGVFVEAGKRFYLDCWRVMFLRRIGRNPFVTE